MEGHAVVRRTLLVACALLMAHGSWFIDRAFSQTTDAHALLQRTETLLQQGGGVEATFTLTSPEGAARGTIHLQGQCFVVETSDMKTWFDGRDQWTYLPRAGEITISTPTAEEQQTLNPYAWLGLYRSGGYDLEAETLTGTASTATTSKSAAYRVTLTATGSRVLWSRIVISLTASCRLHSVSLTPAGSPGGTSQDTTIILNSYRAGLSYAASHFQPARADYPEADFIDLR